MEYVDLSGEVISVDKVGRYWRVLWNGRIIRTFTDSRTGDALAHGYALALLDGRELRKTRTSQHSHSSLDHSATRAV